MSKTVDERVVEMRFDNQQFERNVQTSMSTLDKLKQSLKLTEASKGLQDVDSAAKRVDMSGLGNAVESVKARFSALQVMGVTALANITNSAVNAGKQMLSALTVEPIKAGFQEYETQMNSVQTILANTQKEGTNVKVVNKALDELNTYADKTIYNFTEMTRNIGTFTAAGVKLDTSVNSIKGIANLAAVSGSTSQQASTAMYQLSQAIASGTVKLMDWNSVVNAGMGGQVFQDALIRTAEHLGTGAKAAVKAKGSFRESLQTGWLTTEVLTQTLDQFATAADTQEEYEAAVKKFVDQGYSKEEAKQMADMAKTAGEAATKVKTFTQLIDTLKEALGSGWTTSWRIIVGDFEEAKSLWTDVSDYFSDAINKSSEARNKMLQGWADGGGRTMAIEGIKNAFDGLLSVIKPIKEAFREVFPPATAKQLLSITENFKKLTEKFKIGSETADKLKRTFKGVFSILDIGKKAITALIKPFATLAGSKGISSFADLILSITASIGDFFTALNEGAGASKFFSTISETLSKTFRGISKIFKSATKGIRSFGDIFSKICSGITKFAVKVRDVVADAFGWISEHVSIGDVFAGLAGGGIIATLKKVSGLIDKIKDAVNSIFGEKKDLSMGIGKQFKEILDEVHNSLKAFTTGIKISSLISIAVSIGILTASLKTISQIKADDIAKSIAAIGLMMKELSLTLRSVTKTIKANGTKGVIKAAFALILIARAIKIMAGAIEKLSKLSLREIGRGLAGVGGGLGELCAAVKIINKTKISLKTSVSLLALAYSCKILGDALQKFAKLSWSEIGRGLTAMGGALTELVASVSVLGKFAKGKSILGSIGIFIIVKSLKDLAESMASFADMEWDEIGRGLTAMGGALVEVGGVVAALGKIAGLSSLFAAGSIAIVIDGLDDLAESMASFADMSWPEIGRGLTAMGGALAELLITLGILQKVSKVSNIFRLASVIILIKNLDTLANALLKFGSMSWSEIGRGLTAMGGALAELIGTLGALQKVSKISNIFRLASVIILIKNLDTIANALLKFGSMSWSEVGRGLTAMGGALAELLGTLGILQKVSKISDIFRLASVIILIKNLDTLADALIKFGSMSWSEVGRGLSAMGGSLLEVGGISGALGKIVGLSGIFGAGTILIVIKGLNDLADALIKFGSMSWSEVGRGLTAMGGALLEVGGVAGALGALVGIAGIFGAGTIWIATKGLDDLANAFVKFGSMSWSEVGRGLTAMGGALLEVGGISGALGALVGIAGVFGAGTIWVATQGLGDLADALIKFGSMSWEEIGRGLTAMGGALLEVGGISGGLGALAGIAGIFGAGTIWVAVQGLSDLADALAKFGSMSWDEIGRGLTSMIGALTEVAFGSLANILSGLGALSIAKIAKPLGDLADSVKKWSGVTLPENIGQQLSELASGVMSFTFTKPGAGGLSKAAEPLGILADSVKKWSGVTVPEGLDDQLTNLATGIKSFSFAFAGGWSISALVGPLGNLVDPVLKWKGVTIPATLGTDLSALATGVKAFSFAFAGGWSISAIIGPLGDLSESVKKWAGITIPIGIKDNLTNISNGIKEFSLIDAAKLSMIDGPMDTLGNALKNIGSIQGTGENLVTFSNNIQTCVSNLTGNTFDIDTVSKTISKLVDIIKNVNGTDVSNVLTFVNAANSLNNIKIGKITVNTKELSSAVSAIRNTMNSISEEIISKKSSLEVAMRTAVSGLGKAASSKKNDLRSSGKELGKAIADGIKDKQSSVKSAAKTLASKGSDGAKDKKSSFQSAGKNLGEGLVEGINSKQQAVYNAGYALGQKAVQGEKDGQKSSSPSKLTIKAGKWLGEGLIIGMRRMSNLVYNSGYDLGKTAVDSMSSTIAHISDIFDSSIDAQPTIRPVVDLSRVESGAKSIGKMLNIDPSIGIMSNITSINSMMSRRQNGSNDVVNAIKDLSNKIDNRPGDTYNFGDFTYSDGTEVSDAIKTLVRAARIERRN